jgi:hypothetical protein
MTSNHSKEYQNVHFSWSSKHHPEIAKIKEHFWIPFLLRGKVATALEHMHYFETEDEYEEGDPNFPYDLEENEISSEDWTESNDGDFHLFKLYEQYPELIDDLSAFDFHNECELHGQLILECQERYFDRNATVTFTRKAEAGSFGLK